MSKPVPVKRLSELLQDQQEPFKLRVYISERRYIKTNSSSESRIGPNGSKLDSSVKNLRSNNSNVKRRKLLNGSKVLIRLVLDMLISSKDSSKLSNRGRKYQRDKDKFSKKAKKHQHSVVESSSSRTVFGSCSKGINIVEECYLPIKIHSSHSQSSVRVLKLQKLKKLEAASNTKLQWGYTEESKQCSPVSVLEELPSEEGSPVDKNSKCYLEAWKEENPSAATEDSIFSASLCQLLVQIPIEKQNGVKALIRTEKLIFYCVKEAIDNNGRKLGTREKSFGEMLGPEELGKILCEQIYSWDKKSEDYGTSTTSQVMNSHFSNTVEEWSDFKQTIDDIGIEIGDDILDDIVKDMLIFNSLEYIYR